MFTKAKKVAALGAAALMAVGFAAATPAQGAPPAPTNVHTVWANETQIRVGWSALLGPTFWIWKDGARVPNSSGTNLEETISGLAKCTTYGFQVEAVDSTGSGKSAVTYLKTTGTCPTPTTAPPATDSAATKLNWGTPITAGSDEFNYIGAPDSAKWDSYDTSGHNGAGRRMKAQSVVGDGFLTHTGLPNGDTGYVSSKYRPGTMYGNWEARMRTNLRDSEYHPVMLLWPDTGAHITTEDEVDFAEGTWDTSKMKFYLHYGPAGSATQKVEEKVIDTTQWHNYAVSWSPTAVRGYIDGVLWFEDTEASHSPGQPMHSAIQLDWFPDGTALAESKMQVDWFRQYVIAGAEN